MPPLLQDPVVLSRVQASTLDSYRRAGAEFADWLVAHSLSPASAEQWDDLLVEWRLMEGVPK